MEQQRPHIIHFPKIGEPSIGYISIAEKENLPFTPKRIYWTYFTPESVERGMHSHYELEQILVAVSGKIIITTEFTDGYKKNGYLTRPTKAFLYQKCAGGK
ncbi:FdtA/QdtA family cupin domain-containing protein [Flavobacterium sp. J372]|nr:FdtA/QdtA family cupin domain-containing protein [Flavobacterium sp. J372]MCR5862138.1 FdtA/QdtA family cupin domain-containing protein [Flavobacterium sp. J372]